MVSLSSSPPLAALGLPTPRLTGMALALVLALGSSCSGASAMAAESLCFQTLIGQPGRLTIEQLRLELRGQRVSGFYNWFPWQKDRRVGRLEGRLPSPGTARVLYRFLQEGQHQQARLTIVFNNRQARISWDPPEKQGASPAQPMPDVVLPRQACAQLKPVPGL
jgi:hypothetical protein